MSDPAAPVASTSASTLDVPADLRFHSRAELLWQRLWRDDPERPGYWLTRFVVLRLLGLCYLMAFLTLVFQGRALIGEHGLLPAAAYLDRVAAQAGSRGAGFFDLPSIFWISASDHVLLAAGWTGVALALLVTAGYANALMLLVLWALQLSIANIGQVFYSFGWEMQLAETGFLCVFLCPLLDGRPFSRRAPAVIVIWLLRWLIVRIMLGAGLIKLRGDPCWRDLSCLDYHFETQPVPNPLSPAFHALPHWAHATGVAFNHLVELVAPLLLIVSATLAALPNPPALWLRRGEPASASAITPRRLRHIAGVLMVALQVILLLSGNLSFLNWLTLVPIAACFDDGFLRRLLPRALLARATAARAAAGPARAQRIAVGTLAAVILLLSVEPALNLLSGQQLMNASFNRLQLVNTYGAFGSVGRERDELIFEGTRDDTITPQTKFQAYEWKCKPGDPARRPCLMSPYHHRLDWLIWFAAMGDPAEYPWAIHLVWKLLQADSGTLSLLASDPFAGQPPRHIRVQRYRYRFAPLRAPVTWERTPLGTWLPPLSTDNEDLRTFLRQRGWLAP